MERFPEPTWVVVGAGTGGTSATIGRFVRYRGLGTRLCVVDPENSAFLAAFRDPGCGETTCGSRIEGIGRPRAEPSFLPDLVDRLPEVLRRRRRRVVRPRQVKYGVLPHLGVVVLKKRDDLIGSEHGDNLRGPVAGSFEGVSVSAVPGAGKQSRRVCRAAVAVMTARRFKPRAPSVR